MAKNGKRLKKVDVRQKRKKLMKEQEKDLKKQNIPIEKKQPETEKDQELEIKLSKETTLYWIRAITGALSAFVGRLLLGLIGWRLLIWMLGFWFGFPFIVNLYFFSHDKEKWKYDKEKWNWKNIIKPGIGIFFFLFMIVGVIIHTLLLFG